MIVHEEALPHWFWRLARVKELIVGRDGQTRGATVSVASKNRRFTSLNRRYNCSYPLEISQSTELIDQPQETEGSDTADKSENSPSGPKHPKHASARRA